MSEDRSLEETMQPLEKLPLELAWQSDGHVTDVVLTAMADGEEAIVPEDALGHVEACEHCTFRLGSEALLSVHVDEEMAALAAAAPATAMVPARKAPKVAIGVAIAVAGIGATPAFVLDVAPRASEFFKTIVWAASMLAQSAIVVSRSELFTALVWASALVLVLAGLLMSRAKVSDHSLQEGGV
jgi:hypothetical protein